MKDPAETGKTGTGLVRLPTSKAEKHVDEVAEALCRKHQAKRAAKQDDKDPLELALEDLKTFAGLLIDDF